MATAVKQVGRAVSGDHLCLPYATDEELRAVLARFIIDGLSMGEKVVYVSDTAVPEAMSLWLRSLEIDSAPLWARGQLQLRSATELYAPRGRFEVELAVKAIAAEVGAAAGAGYRGLRLMSEMSWALAGVPGVERLPEFERRVQPVYSERGITGICQYDTRRFSPAAISDHTACHWLVVEPDALLDDQYLRITRTFAPSGLRMSGTVDRTTCGALESVLARWLIAEAGDIHLDMAGLDFIDVAGLRLLVDTARALEGGRVLRLVNLAPMLRRVVGIVGWDDTPGLELVDDGAVSV